MEDVERYYVVIAPLLGGVVFVFLLAWVLDILEEKYWK